MLTIAGGILLAVLVLWIISLVPALLCAMMDWWEYREPWSRMDKLIGLACVAWVVVALGGLLTRVH